MGSQETAATITDGADGANAAEHVAARHLLIDGKLVGADRTYPR